jgi:hypothetical protein
LAKNGYTALSNVLHCGLQRSKLVEQNEQNPDSEYRSIVATSVDGIIALQNNANDAVLVCPLEFKSLTTEETFQRGIQRLSEARQVTESPDQEFFVCHFGSELCSKLVWLPQYRAQIFHHCATFNTSQILFVVSGLTGILYICHVYFDSNLISVYLSFIHRISRTHLEYFVNEQNFINPGLQTSEYAHATDLHTLQLWRKFAQALARHNRQTPLPPAHDIIPYVVSYWNHTKGGQDVASRILKNVKVDFSSLTPRGFLHIRMIMSSLMNSHLLLRLLSIEDKLEQFSTFHDLKKALNKLGSFEDYLRKFVHEWEPSLSVLAIFASELSSIPPNIGTSEVSQVFDTEHENQSGDQRFRVPRRNRLSFFNTQTGSQRRLNVNARHEALSQRSRHCVACTNRTTNFCNFCQVSMCRTQPQTGSRTCWERFHENQILRYIRRPVVSTRGRRGCFRH